MSEILDVEKPIRWDTSVTQKNNEVIHPTNPNALGNNDIIHFSVNQADALVHPEKAFFVVWGRLTKLGADKVTEEKAAKTHITSGGILHAFSRAELTINSKTVEQVIDVGLTCMGKILTTYNDWMVRHLQLMGWGERIELQNDGSFNGLIIPFKVLFALGDDFVRVLVNSRVGISLTRARTDDNVVHCSEAENYIFKLKKIQFHLPYIGVDDVNRLRLLKIIEHDKALMVGFRAWELYQYPELPATTKHTWSIKTSSLVDKPRYVIVFFQTKRTGDKMKDGSKFDHCNLRNLTLKLNNERYPKEDLDQNFEKNDYSLFYHMYCEFTKEYTGNAFFWPVLTMNTFKNDNPLFVIDCANQRETLKMGGVDIRLDFEANTPFPAGTTANSILVRDSVFQYHPLTGGIVKYEG